jgi:hypothetical protein
MEAPDYRERSRADPAPLQPPGLLPPDPVLHVHCWSRLLPDLPSPSSLQLPPPSRSPLPFPTAATAPLLDPYARSPAAALQEPEPKGMEAEMGR